MANKPKGYKGAQEKALDRLARLADTNPRRTKKNTDTPRNRRNIRLARNKAGMGR